MQQISFQTQRGADVALSLQDTTIALTVNGKAVQTSASLDMPVFPDHGTCIHFVQDNGKSGYIPVPAGKLAAVKGLKDQRDANLSAACLNSDAERARKEREWDDLNNEGGDGYNPHRKERIGGPWARRERHYPEGA